MKDESLRNLVGQFCRTSDGQRVFVESIGVADSGLPARALVSYIEGPKKGTRGSFFVTTLEPLGAEIPVNEDIPEGDS
jgi:hypothetical protein